MLIAGIIVFCVVVLLLAFLIPRLSRPVERGGQRTPGAGGRAGGKAPGPLGRLLRKPFDSGGRAVGKSGSAGRRGRGKLPL